VDERLLGRGHELLALGLGELLGHLFGPGEGLADGGRRLGGQLLGLLGRKQAKALVKYAV
jgi:hypothetical protein